MKVFIAIAVLVFFIGRDYACKHFFPEMRTVTGDWDGSNNLTMYTYSMVILLSFLFGRLNSTTRSHKFIWDVAVGVSLSDVVDRLWFDVTVFNESDYFLLALTIIMSYLDIYFQVFDKLGQIIKSKLNVRNLFIRHE
jgi:hypothetical protein